MWKEGKSIMFATTIIIIRYNKKNMMMKEEEEEKYKHMYASYNYRYFMLLGLLER